MTRESEELEAESIAGRIVDFLRGVSPFDHLSTEALTSLARSAGLSYHEDGEELFEAGQAPLDRIFLVRKGQVDILAADGSLADRCSEGEIFGGTALLGDGHYLATARVSGEALLLRLPAVELRSLMGDYPVLLHFFFSDAQSGPGRRQRRLAEINRDFGQIKQGSYRDAGTRTLTDFKAPITCRPNTSLQEVARIMREHGIGSMILAETDGLPRGIVTNSDLRNSVVTGEVPLNRPVSAIMRSPVLCAPAGESVDTYLLQMVREGIQHLCITRDGTDRTAVTGVFTDHDLLLETGNSPAVLLKALQRAQRVDELAEAVGRVRRFIRQLVEADQPVRHICHLAEGFNRQLLDRALHFAFEEVRPKLTPEDFCWLAVGSVARAEQVLPTDFDAGLVLAGGKGHLREDAQRLAAVTYRNLVACGFHEDRAGVQASNPEWIKTVYEWEQLFESWMETPLERSLLHATIFFDLMPFYGNGDLGVQLQEVISRNFQRRRSFSGFLALNALKNPPPLGFFKGFLLEKSGEHANTFDIKLRAMMPLANAARLLSLQEGTVYPSSTVERFHRVAEANADLRERVEEGAEAYEIFLRLRAEQGYRHGDDGRYIDPNELSPLEKRVLKDAFGPIGELQSLIKPN